MPRLKLLAAAATAGLLVAGGAVAQTSTTVSFSQLDKDNDGRISRAEWKKHFAADAPAGSGSTAQGGDSNNVERRDVGARRGYPTSRTGEPVVGGSITSDDPPRGADDPGGPGDGKR